MANASILIIVVMQGCSETNIDPSSACLLHNIIYNESEILQFETVSGGKIYQIKDRVINETDQYQTLNVYQFKYNYNSVDIINLSDPYAHNRPLIHAIIENERLVKIARYFSESGVTLTHIINYDKPNNIHIDVTWLDSDSTFLKYGYADYHINENGNVTRFEKYQYYPYEQSIPQKTEDVMYTYDDKISPWKGLIFPFFATASVTDIKFFSTNNILTVEDQFEKQLFDYTYNRNGHPIKLSSTKTGKVEFEYLNCSE